MKKQFQIERLQDYQNSALQLIITILFPSCCNPAILLIL